MTLRVLMIDEKAKADVARVRAYAEAHHYYPGKSETPGDDPRFVAHLGTYRAVFSFTHAEGLVFRHLSVSVPSEKFPAPIAAFTIADLFGFTGWSPEMGEKLPEDWQAAVNEREHCVTLAQPIEMTVPKEARQ